MMANRNTVQIGPWTAGQDTFHDDPNHAVFQSGGEVPARLISASNVDVTDEGWAVLRPGLVERVAATAGLNGFSGTGLMLLQDGGVIKKIDPSDWSESSLVTGLGGARIEFLEHAGEVFWTDGTSRGRISSAGVASPWGLSVPDSPTLGNAAGSLPVGRYLVCCTVQLGNEESGAPDVTAIELGSAGGITVTAGSLDSNATHVNIYASAPDQPELFWQQKAAVGALPVTLSALATDTRATDRPLRTQHLGPPIAGDGLFSYLGQICIFRDGDTFRSKGLSKTLFDYMHGDALPNNILGAAGLETGFWRVTAKGSWWTTGVAPEWRSMKKDSFEYASGGYVVPGEVFPHLQTQALVALFFSEHGPMVGLPTGQMIRFVPDQVSETVTGLRLSIYLYEASGIRRVAFCLS